jgi:hypothetical protein
LGQKPGAFPVGACDVALVKHLLIRVTAEGVTGNVKLAVLP